MEILDAYIDRAPDPQTILDIFTNEWSSKMPVESGLIATPGPAALFEDGRIDWLSKTIGGFANKRILELGPLEAGHTYMMHNGGAASITAIEANSRSYLKCLCIQQIFNLNRASFLYADAMAYADQCNEEFDLCVASGILYHMTAPVDFIRQIGRMSKTMFIWTHYYDESIRSRSDMSKQFHEPQEIEIEGHTYTAVKRTYDAALNWAGFCGGSKSWALWLTRDSLFRALEDAGFVVDGVSFDQADHPNGPSLALVATRKP
ncbi:class I SAM-dependent methyltransferase [Consotaella aegiceratis]|uniref:class I SAM-dependent methyltransferase n=1 Tax=Consotaella aegiceratis TaxID=3097961 RepID=UPI002F3F870D